jgi:flavin-dependent thymidylate synthase
VFKNVSRAFQQQLTRHRTAAYSIQSMRVVPKEEFAVNHEFHTPGNAEFPAVYEDIMFEIEDKYRELLDLGEKTEVARGILPLNIFSPITMSINLRALIGLISARLCNMTQGEFKTVALMMIKEVCDKMGSEFSYLFSAPCERDFRCPHAITCGKHPLLDSCEGKFNDRIKSFMRS